MTATAATDDSTEGRKHGHRQTADLRDATEARHLGKQSPGRIRAEITPEETWKTKHRTRTTSEDKRRRRRRNNGRLVDGDGVKTLKNLSHRDTSVTLGSTPAKNARLSGAEFIYPEFLLRSRTPPPGGENYFYAKRATCKNAIKIKVIF